MKTTLTAIKNYYCTDVTRYSKEEIDNLMKSEKAFNRVCYSVGVYGVNGVVLQGYTTKTLYKITSRNSNLFYLY